MVNFGSLLEPYQKRVNQALNILLPKEGYSRLSDAMRYSVLNSGVFHEICQHSDQLLQIEFYNILF